MAKKFEQKNIGYCSNIKISYTNDKLTIVINLHNLHPIKT